MAEHDRGPAAEYEVVWKSGHVDRFRAHQVSRPNNGGLLGGLFGAAQSDPLPERIEFHGEFDGRWQLVLSAPMAEIATIRNATVCGDSL